MQELITETAQAPSTGFRLERLEVYNWGTFNRHVWTIEPGGGMALLTGANGSGKSTLVDALLTLLVPNKRRNYNQASGDTRRRERDEKSYVRGAYGRIKDEESNRGVVQYLRGTDSYSVLLACFANRRLHQELTLAHVFYWREQELKKIFVVAPRQLSIAEHMQIAGSPDELRRQLRSLGAEVYDEFSRYSRALVKRLRLRSEKALDLFNQTVSIKEIGGLNEFVRQHMLERNDTAEKIVQLRDTYQNLTRAHDAIARAEAQLQRLAPMLAEADQHDHVVARIAEAEHCAGAVPLFFARRKIDLLDRAAHAARVQVDEDEQRADAFQSQVEGLRQREKDLYAAIQNDQVGQQLQQLQQELKYTSERRDARRRQAEKYNAAAKKLDLSPYVDHETFFATRRKANDAVAPIERRLQAIGRERDDRKQEEGQRKAACRDLAQEIESLRQRRSRIPADDLRIRAALTQTLGIDENALPFIGELLRVRVSEATWEPAIERLLGGYGRQMIVPDAHYRAVMGYVDATNLRGRLVYHRADTRRHARSSTGLDQDALFHKLEIKPDAALHDWLRADLLEYWEYICCETAEQFQREQRALTVNGQVKRGGARHEKDDRSALGDRARYVLGWDNRDKIAALEAELARESTALAATQQAIKKLEDEQEQRKRQLQTIRELLAFDDVAAIDWHADARQVEELERRRRDLEASSHKLAELNAQLAAMTEQIKALEGDLSRTRNVLATLRQDLARYEKQRATAIERLAAGTEPPPEVSTRLEKDLKATALNLETIDEQQAQAEKRYLQSASSLRGQATPLRDSITAKMSDFKRDYPEDTTDMDRNIVAVGEYRRLHDRIARDDLPTYRRRFKEWLDGKVLDAIVGFTSSLNKQVDEYHESIDRLNESLATIDYSGSTYIQLRANPNQERAIQEFRLALRACMPDVGQRTPESNEQSFQRIRALIERFDKEEYWTAKVTDTRNWLDFAAEELYRADRSRKDYYEDSSGKSGGQKAKLAYTILASAIAYQYGLAQDDDQNRTFRFVVVDEAFSKSDETNARYAMDLFRQLNLQLLVVTPLHNTHVVEPYITAVHFVSNTPEENDSRVVSLTIEQYRAQKAAFQQMARLER
jgi:uncharacterized protein YPO0396